MNERQIAYNSKYIPTIEIKRLKNSDEELLALAVMDGAFGNGDYRKKRIEEKGYSSKKIQDIVNDMCSGSYEYSAKFDEVFSSEKITKMLLSMSFTLSVNDITGSFSLTFFPETQDGESVFDKIHILDVVKIYEPTIEEVIIENEDLGNGKKYILKQVPVFTGMVKTKKFVTQTDGDGGMRRLSISGISVTGLVSQFKVNLDTSAMAITKEMREQENLQKEMTLSLGDRPDKPVKNVVETIWKYFLKVSSQNGTPKVGAYINAIMGNGKGGLEEIKKDTTFFDIDESINFHYPLGCVFNGNQTQDFWNIIDGIIPSPMYEKFSYMGADGKMKIKIRECPFDSDRWEKCFNEETGNIDNKFLKSCEISQSDSEVYTVFYAYLNGSPIDEQKSLVLSTMEMKEDSVVSLGAEYLTYGYRPLVVHFIGYSKKDGQQDSTTQENLKNVSQKLCDWFKNLPKMFKGSITLAMSQETKKSIMPGDVIKFLSVKGSGKKYDMQAEFYVEGVTHNWNYGVGGDINITVSRGGVYKNGVFQASETAQMGVGRLAMVMESMHK